MAERENSSRAHRADGILHALKGIRSVLHLREKKFESVAERRAGGDKGNGGGEK